MIELKKVAYVKTTDEPVFVLGMRKDANSGETIVTVRRPIQAETGVSHMIEEFFFDELQTKEDQMTKEMDTNKFMLKLRDALAKERQEQSRVDLPEEPVREPYIN